MEEDDEFEPAVVSKFKTPLKRKNKIIDDDDDEETGDNNKNITPNKNRNNKSPNKNNNNNNNNKSPINKNNNDDLNTSFKTPSPKVTKSRLRKQKALSPSSPSLDINFTSPNRSPKTTPSKSTSSSPKSTTPSPKQQNSITRRNNIPKTPPQVTQSQPQQDDDNPWDMNQDYNINEDGSMSNNNNDLLSPVKSTFSSPSSSPTVNKRAPVIGKISNKKVISRTIKDQDLLSFKGVSKLYTNLKLAGFSAKHSNKANLEKLFAIYSKWTKEINPTVSLEDSIIKVEALSKSRIVKNHIDDLKNGVVFTFSDPNGENNVENNSNNLGTSESTKNLDDQKDKNDFINDKNNSNIDPVKNNVDNNHDDFFEDFAFAQLHKKDNNNLSTTSKPNNINTPSFDQQQQQQQKTAPKPNITPFAKSIIPGMPGFKRSGGIQLSFPKRP